MTPKKRVIKMPNGEKVEMFYIIVLAQALGRTQNLIRKWEIGGIIPPSSFRDEKNNRLYTKEQIDVIVSTAEKLSLIHI